MTVQVVPDPETDAMVGVPVMPLPEATVKFAAATPDTLSLNVTVKTGALEPVVSATALLARTIEVTVGAVWSTVTARLDDALPVFPAVSLAFAVIVWLPIAKVVAML